jgi:membrane protein implicated in regulation of membrane protease activity
MNFLLGMAGFVLLAIGLGFTIAAIAMAWQYLLVILAVVMVADTIRYYRRKRSTLKNS